MAVASLVEIMAGLADQIRLGIGAEDYGIQVESIMVTNPSPPTVDMFTADPPENAESAGFGAYGGDQITVRARVATGDSVESQLLLYEMQDWASDTSVTAAVLSDVTLAGMARLSVSNPSGLRQYVDPGGEGIYLGCEWTVLALRMES